MKYYSIYRLRRVLKAHTGTLSSVVLIITARGFPEVRG